MRSWKPSESLIVDGNPAYWGGAPGFERVVMRHIAEPATQMLLLEKGDVDIARNLEADQLESLRDNPDITVREVPKGAIYYLGLNQKNEYLARPYADLAPFTKNLHKIYHLLMTASRPLRSIARNIR